MNRSGQAVVEYIILLGVVVLVYSSMINQLSNNKVMLRLNRIFTEDFAHAYRYGHPEARGQDDGGPVNIPQVSSPPYSGQNFRIFINPTKQ